nr:VanR-ABDEGLN family response regulator transcription factor [uncultured Solibaculum sp.]
MDASIMIVDDEKEIADLVEVYLKNENYQVMKFYDAKEALQCAGHHRLDLAILDVMMPGMDGFTLCRKLREQYTFPILMLTAKGEDLDKITGLTIGADDYITKPFNPLELVARVKAQLRRYTRYNQKEPEELHRIEIDGLVIDQDTHRCTLYDRPLSLTPTEFSILWILCENRGKVISSERLFETVWGEKYLESNNTVMVHIRRLREKMHEDSRRPRFIKTVWGVGYQIDK